MQSNKQQGLSDLLDGYKITQTFQPGQRIHPYHGAPSPIKNEKIPAKSHCSAFVFRVCQDLNLPMIGGNVQLLANLQHEWLQQKGHINGWNKCNQDQIDERLANGDVVIAIISGNDDSKPGHIAICRSANNVIQAGMTNFENVEIEKGFHFHLEGRDVSAIEFYSHPTEDEVIQAALQINPQVIQVLGLY